MNLRQMQDVEIQAVGLAKQDNGYTYHISFVGKDEAGTIPALSGVISAQQVKQFTDCAPVAERMVENIMRLAEQVIQKEHGNKDVEILSINCLMPPAGNRGARLMIQYMLPGDFMPITLSLAARGDQVDEARGTVQAIMALCKPLIKMINEKRPVWKRK